MTPCSRALAVVALAGCDLVFPLEGGLEPGAPDASSTVDECVPASSHDEDRDGVPDGCDACPGVANASLHSDTDGIPDECDPRPTLDGDVQVEFISFAESNAVTRWLAEDASWAIDGETIRFANTALLAYSAMRDANPPPPPPFVIAGHVVIEQLESPGSIAVAIWGGGDQLVCAIERTSERDQLMIWHGDSGGETESVVIPPITPGATYLLELAYGASGATCRARSGTLDLQVSVVDPPAVSRIGFEAAAITARVEHATLFVQRR